MQNWDWCEYNSFQLLSVIKIISCKCYSNTEALEIISTVCKNKQNNLQEGHYFYSVILVDSLLLWRESCNWVSVFLIDTSKIYLLHLATRITGLFLFFQRHDGKCPTLLGSLFNNEFDCLNEECELCWLRNCDHSTFSGQKLTLVASRKTFPLRHNSFSVLCSGHY